MVQAGSWHVAGSYYEACNCEAVCPCRRQNGVAGGKSTYGVCQFVLSWRILDGAAVDVPLSGLNVAIAGFYNDDDPGEPWTVRCYIDERANDAQYAALTSVFQGQWGGSIEFTAYFRTILESRRAKISLDHRAGAEWVSIENAGGARVVKPALFDGVVSCGIPGHDHPGIESVSASEMAEDPMHWSYEARCGFATDFRYSN